MSELKITKGKMTEKEIIDLSMSVAKKIDATYLTKRKQIYFKKKGSKTSICFFMKSQLSYTRYKKGIDNPG